MSILIILIILLSLVAVPTVFYAELLAWKNKKLEEEIESLVIKSLISKLGSSSYDISDIFQPIGEYVVRSYLQALLESHEIMFPSYLAEIRVTEAIAKPDEGTLLAMGVMK